MFGRYFKLQPISIFAICNQTLVNTCNHSVHYSVVTCNKTALFIFMLASVKVHLGTSKCYLIADIVLSSCFPCMHPLK